MHDGAGVEHAAEIRQPPVGGRAADEIERPGVDREDRDPRRPIRSSPSSSDRVERARFEHRDTRAAAQRSGAAIDAGGDQHQHATPTGAAAAAELRAQQRRRTTKQARGSNERQHAPARFRLRSCRVSTSVNVRRFAHMSAAPATRRRRAEPRQHGDARPRRREQLAREQLANDQQDVEDDREMRGVEQADRQRQRQPAAADEATASGSAAARAP